MLRSLLERHDALTKENAGLSETVQRLKTENGEASQKKLESLQKELVAREEEVATASIELARADEKIQSLNAQLADAVAAEEQLRLRIRLVLQQFGEHVQQSINQQPRQAQPHSAPLPSPTLPTVEPEPSAPEHAPQLPCDGAATDEYTSSSPSSESEAEPAQAAPPPSEL